MGKSAMTGTENMTYFLTMGNIIMRILFGLKKNDENDCFLNFQNHTDVKAGHLQLKKHLIQ